MRLYLAASGWITDEPRGVRLRFWNDTSIGPPPDEIRVERAVIPNKRPSWVVESDPPSWLGAPADWWSGPHTIALDGDPLAVWELGAAVDGVAFEYDGLRALVVASFGGVRVWSRVVDPGETVHIAAPCDRVTIRAMTAVLRSARLFDPASLAAELAWTPIVTVRLRAGLDQPWSAVERRASSLLALDNSQWRTLAEAIARRFDKLLPAGATVEQAEPEIALNAAWSAATVCGFGFRDGPGAWAEFDEVDGAALLVKKPKAPLAYRIVDPSGRLAPSAPVAVPAGSLRNLAAAPPHLVTATLCLAPEDRHSTEPRALFASRRLTWRLGDSLADRAAFDERFGDGPGIPIWETRASNGARPGEPDVMVSMLSCPAVNTPLIVRQRVGDSWGRWTAWSDGVSAIPTPDHHPSPPPLLAVFAESGSITMTLGNVDGAPTPPWRLDSLALALHGRIEVLRRRALPETIGIELAVPVQLKEDLWRYNVAPAIDPARFIGGIVNTRGVRCEVVSAFPDAIVVRASIDGASRLRLPAAGAAMLVAARDRDDLWASVGEVAAPGPGENLVLAGSGAHGREVYALRVVYDGGRGPLGNEVRAFAAVVTPPLPPKFRARFQAFDAHHCAVFIITFTRPPDSIAIRIGWTWSRDTAGHLAVAPEPSFPGLAEVSAGGNKQPRFAREPLVALDAVNFFARIDIPDPLDPGTRRDVLAAVTLWASHETASGIGKAVRGELEPVSK